MAAVAHRAIGPHIGQPSHPGDLARHGRVVQDEPQGELGQCRRRRDDGLQPIDPRQRGVQLFRREVEVPPVALGKACAGFERCP